MLTQKSKHIYETVIVSFSLFFLNANYIVNYYNLKIIGMYSAFVINKNNIFGRT